MRLLLATALGLMVAACAGPYPYSVTPLRPQSAHARGPQSATLSPSRPSVRPDRSLFTPGVQTATPGSDNVPLINVDQVCQGIAQQGGTSFHDPIVEAKKHCLSTEQEIREEMVKAWGTFERADKAHCANETSRGGESSYTELLTCLEMAREVRKIHEPDLAPHEQAVGQR